MHPEKRIMLLINLIGGTAVLASYVYGVLTHPNASQVLWGEVPEGIRPIYTVNMFLAAIGYFAFIYFILFRLDPVKTRVAGRFNIGLFNNLFAVILIPSALWMPLTLLAAEQSSMALVWMVRIVLWLVGLASMGLFIAILKVEPRHPLWAQRLALLGSIFFCIQTVILDAIVWPVFFRM